MGTRLGRDPVAFGHSQPVEEALAVKTPAPEHDEIDEVVFSRAAMR
jgi:hypothetical protein